MSDSRDRERTADRRTPRGRPDEGTGAGRMEVIPDPESDTVTFVPAQVDAGDVTTAWLSVDAGLLVDPTEVR